MSNMTSQRSARRLAAFMAGAGVTHLVLPKPYDATIPAWLPGRARTWTYGSGMIELALAAALAVPRTRRLGSLVTAGFFVGVLPANVKMAYDWRHRALPLRAAAYGRIPVQAPLVLWALRVGRDAE